MLEWITDQCRYHKLQLILIIQAVVKKARHNVDKVNHDKVTVIASFPPLKIVLTEVILLKFKKLMT